VQALQLRPERSRARRRGWLPLAQGDELERSGADHRDVPLLLTAPGCGWINSFTVACDLGDIGRFPSPVKLIGYTGLCPRITAMRAPDHSTIAEFRRRPEPALAEPFASVLALCEEAGLVEVGVGRRRG
jgi:Transposase IS116/IS110/IS902 family